MRTSIIVFMIAFLVMFSSVDAFVVTKNKKTVTNENDTICI